LSKFHLEIEESFEEQNLKEYSKMKNVKEKSELTEN